MRIRAMAAIAGVRVRVSAGSERGGAGLGWRAPSRVEGRVGCVTVSTMRARVALLGVAAVVVCGAMAAVAFGRRDPAARRALYDEFPVFPGADEVSADAYRITGDGRPTHGPRVTGHLRAPR